MKEIIIQRKVCKSLVVGLILETSETIKKKITILHNARERIPTLLVD